jgi:adenosylcobinamide-GDP ribazoletransferase
VTTPDLQHGDAPREAAPVVASRFPFFRGIRSAFVFLTRIPVGGFPFSPADFSWASAHFPLVGAVLGCLMFGVAFVLHSAGAWVASCFAITTTLILTGAFHEDGLADSVDALGGAYDKARVFTILKDSRVGSFGAAGLSMSLLIRVGALSSVLEQFTKQQVLGALLLTQGVSRWVPLLLMRALPYVTESSTAKSKHMTRAGGLQLLTATSTTVLLALASVSLSVSFFKVAAIFVAGLCTALVLGLRFHRRMGGITGDFLGATQQVSECVFWALLLVKLP